VGHPTGRAGRHRRAPGSLRTRHLPWLPRTDQRARGEGYRRGRLLDGRRKSVRPMAARLGGEAHTRRRTPSSGSRRGPGGRSAAATGVPKDGDRSVGGQRPCSSPPGKVATASRACRSTRSPGTPPARWTGGCWRPSPGTTRPSGGWRLVPDVLDELDGAGAGGHGRATATSPARSSGWPWPPGRACVDLIWRRGSKGLQRSRLLALRVRPAGVTPRRQAAAGATSLRPATKGVQPPSDWPALG
jgi:hypothetical protein